MVGRRYAASAGTGEPSGPSPAAVRGWLVLLRCPDCKAPREAIPELGVAAFAGRYCERHGPGNWWLTVYDGPPFGKRHTP